MRLAQRLHPSAHHRRPGLAEGAERNWLMTSTPIEALAAHKRLGRTGNLGPDFGAPVEQGWTIEVTPAHLEACARHDFTAIRLLICFAAHGNPAGLDPGMLRRLEAIM